MTAIVQRIVVEMHGLNVPTKIFRRPEFQLPLVALVAILFILVTYLRWIPSIAAPILGISLPSEIIASGFAVMFALLSFRAFVERDTKEKRTARIDAYCSFVERNLVRRVSLSEAQSDIASRFAQGQLKPPLQFEAYWTAFSNWYTAYDSDHSELWYYATKHPQDGAFPRECGYAIVNADRVVDRWLIRSIDFNSGG